MALRNAILAALLQDPSSGYDLAKGFDATTANFWTATPQQLYRELDRMESQGLISAEVVEQEKRPNKRVFSPTPAGEDEMRAYSQRKPKPAAIRDELLVQVQAIESGDAEAVRAAIGERIEFAQTKLKRYERLRQHLLEGRTERDFFETANRVGPYLTLLRGISFEEENIRWGELALRVLAARED